LGSWPRGCRSIDVTQQTTRACAVITLRNCCCLRRLPLTGPASIFAADIRVTGNGKLLPRFPSTLSSLLRLRAPRVRRAAITFDKAPRAARCATRLDRRPASPTRRRMGKNPCRANCSSCANRRQRLSGCARARAQSDAKSPLTALLNIIVNHTPNIPPRPSAGRGHSGNGKRPALRFNVCFAPRRRCRRRRRRRRRRQMAT
jgi:hypothetical protein